MCGICGVAAFRGKADPDHTVLAKMMALIDHRGPDDEGYHVDAGIAIGHKRLSIIDLHSGKQPIFNEDRSISIVFNGEIYNYLELKAGLAGKGHVFTTNTDTEVIVHLYEEMGIKCVEKLRGMFTFAIWDKRYRRLCIARDRIGIKPLYYHAGPDGLCFASEMKALIASGLVKREVNWPLLDHYITLNYTLGPQTMIKGVMKLMPGHYLVMENDLIDIQKYWDFNMIPETGADFDNCKQRLGELLEESVKIRLMSDVPLGAFLSGGVDSSVVVAYMTRISGKPVKTFTVGYEDADGVSELKYARMVADHCRSEHHEFILNPKKFMDIVSKVVWHLDEPVAEFATIPLLLLSELAKKHVTVMLSGEGADEIFAGYPIYRYMNYIEHYRKLPRVLRKSILNPIAGKLLGNRREGKYIDWLNSQLDRRYLGNGSYFTYRMKQRLYSDDFRNTLDRQAIYGLVKQQYQMVENWDPVRQMLYMDTKTWLPEDLLIKADKMTMAAGIELRVPFLDHKLLEYATSLPTRMKMRYGSSKHIFKQVAEDLIPAQIVHRPKRGFPVPVKQWLRKDLNKISRDILTERRTIERGLFENQYIQNMIACHNSGKEDFSKEIWNLLIFELWMRTFIEGDMAGA